MERAALKVGTEYAVCESSYSIGYKVTLLSADLHTTRRHSEEIIPTTAKATVGTWRDSAVGVLCKTEKGKLTVVYPRHIASTWVDHVAKKQREHDRMVEKQNASKAKQVRDAANAEILKALWVEKVSADHVPYFSAYDNKVEMTYETLIKILSR